MYWVTDNGAAQVGCRDSNPVKGERVLSFPERPDRLWSPLNLLSNGHGGRGGYFCGVERPGRVPDLSCQYCTEFRREWSCTFTGLCAGTLAFKSTRTVSMCYGVEVCPSTTIWRPYWCEYEHYLRRIYMKAFGTARNPPYSFVGTWFYTGYSGTALSFGWKSSKPLPQLMAELKSVEWGTGVLPLEVTTVLITVHTCGVDKADHVSR